MSEDGPPLFRPIPRRPFDLNLTSATPPDEDSAPPSPTPELQSSRFLNAQYGLQSTPSESGSLSRAQSIINLTASTLFGIFSPTVEGKDRYYAPGEEPDTPWGTGAQTPIKRPSVDEMTFELMKDRSSLLKKRSAARAVQTAPPPSTAEVAFSLGFRTVVLFGLGIGYGALVTRLRTEQNLRSISVEGIIRQDYDWRYLTFWGVAGVALGILQPWFDGVWEDTFGGDADEVISADAASNKESSTGTDWALVVRGVGAFMGIVLAIRKLPWASTLQVSLSLALVNPFLWYLVDRSKPGFLLSAAVGLTGSAVLLTVNPDVMPTPSPSLFRNESIASDPAPAMLGGLATQQTIETGIWMLSVLFCSCVCFGNLGRRLALSRSAAARGRWGGVR